MSEEQTGGENLNEPAVEQAAEKTKSKPSGKGKGGGLLAIIALALIVGAMALFGNLSKNQTAAIVNGEVITKGEYQKQLKAIEKQWQVLYGNEEGVPPVSSPEVQDYIKVAAMDSLINDMLVLNAATQAGIVVSEEEVEAVYQESRDFYPTEKEFRDSIRKELILTRFVEEAVPAEDLTATEAELREIYDMNFPEAETEEEDGEGVMSFEEFSEAVRPRIEAIKFQEAYLAVIEGLRESATIEILIKLPNLADQETETDLGIPESEEAHEEVTTSPEGTTTTATSESGLVENDSAEEKLAE